MLSSVVLSVAMESGDERLKASADIIVPSPDDDGIYLTLKKTDTLTKKFCLP